MIVDLFFNMVPAFLMTHLNLNTLWIKFMLLNIQKKLKSSGQAPMVSSIAYNICLILLKGIANAYQFLKSQKIELLSESTPFHLITRAFTLDTVAISSSN